jgi:hypothetical protein
MATVYINMFRTSLRHAAYLPARLLAGPYRVECLKSAAPDDGEALEAQGKYRVECPDAEWQEVLEILRDSERSLVYSVVLEAANGESIICEAGEMNSTVQHYTTRMGNARRLFAFWFDEELSGQVGRLAA